MAQATTTLHQLPAPDLSRLAVGGASLQVLEAFGFSSDGRQLLVRATFLDDATPGGTLHYGMWVYDLLTRSYTACLNELLAPAGVPASDVEVLSATLVGPASGATVLAQSVVADAQQDPVLALLKPGVASQPDLLGALFGLDSGLRIERYSLSADARFLAVQTDSEKLGTDAQMDVNGLSDIYLLDLLARRIDRVSLLDRAELGAPVRLGNVYVRGSQVEVAFSTAATLVNADRNAGAGTVEAQTDAYLWRSAFDGKGLSGAPSFDLLSRSADGRASGLVGVDAEVITTAAGAYFSSQSADLVTGDTNVATDVFFVPLTGALQRLSPPAGQLSAGADLAGASSNGRYVAVMSSSSDLAGTDALQQVFLVDTRSGNWQSVSANDEGQLANDLVLAGALSPNAAQLAFTTAADNLAGTPAAPGGSLYVRSTGAITGVQLDVLAYTWKGHTLLEGVSIGVSGSAGSASGVTDRNGSVSVPEQTDAQVSLQASRAIPSSETALSNAAVNLQDAIAILKMVVGLNVNPVGQPLSPYQALAADFDGNGRVELSDAIGVLKHVVGLTGPTTPKPTWQFVDEASSAVAGIKGSGVLQPGLPPAIAVGLEQGASTVQAGLVGYLRGDVDGSFGGAPGALDLDVVNPGYFTQLLTEHPGLSLSQFGIYPTT